jgi:hypothetical protein
MELTDLTPSEAAGPCGSIGPIALPTTRSRGCT